MLKLFRGYRGQGLKALEKIKVFSSTFFWVFWFSSPNFKNIQQVSYQATKVFQTFSVILGKIHCSALSSGNVIKCKNAVDNAKAFGGYLVDLCEFFDCSSYKLINSKWNPNRTSFK